MQKTLSPFYLTLIFSLTCTLAQSQVSCEELKKKNLTKTIHFWGKTYEIEYNPVGAFCSLSCDEYPGLETDACAYFYKKERREIFFNDFEPKTGEWSAPSFFLDNSEGMVSQSIFYSSAIFHSMKSFKIN